MTGRRICQLMIWLMLIWFTGNQLCIMPMPDDNRTCIAEVIESDSDQDAEEKSPFIKPCDEIVHSSLPQLNAKSVVTDSPGYMRPWLEIPTPPPGV